MKNVAIVAIFVGLLSSSSTSAFDGSRSGFVMGGGLGVAARAHYEWEYRYSNSVLSLEENHTSAALHFMIGKGWGEQNMVVWEYNSTAYSPDEIPWGTGIQAFQGVCWYHYFGMTGHTYFSTVGAGFYYFQRDFESEAYIEDYGLLLGGGYEFAPHFQAGVYLALGRIEDKFFDFNHYHISLLLSAVAW